MARDLCCSSTLFDVVLLCVILSEPFDAYSYILTADKSEEFGKRLFLGKDQ